MKRYFKKIAIVTICLILIVIVASLIITIRQNTAEHERAVIFNILDYQYAVFADCSYKDKEMREHARRTINVGWDKDLYGDDTAVFGDRIELTAETKASLVSVAYLILLPNRADSKQWSEQEKVQVIIYKAANPERLSTAESAYAFKYNEGYFFMAFEGDVLKEEFHSILCPEFFVDIINHSMEYPFGAKYGFF